MRLILVLSLAALVSGCSNRPAGDSAAKPAAKPAEKVADKAAPATAAAPAPAKSAAKPVAFALRIDSAAAQDRTDASKRVWLSDQIAHSEFKVEGGDVVERDSSTVITGGSLDKQAYLTERWGAMTYRIPVPAGAYDVILHHCETFDGITAAGERLFSVKIEGRTVASDVDVFKAAGGKLNVPVSNRYPVTVSDGTLDIEFVEGVQMPEINAIEVLSAQ